MDPEIFAVFIGGDQFLQGVPARDLTQSEWLEINPDTREQVIALNLFQVPEQPESEETK